MNFIPAQYYYDVYLIIVSLSTLMILTKPQYITIQQYESERINPAYYLAAFFTVFIGFRPESGVFVDMMSYVVNWDWKIELDFSQPSENFIYDHLPYLLNKFGWERRAFFVLISSIYFLGTAYACQRLFGRNAIIAFIVWLAAFSTFSYGTNGQKAGAAATIFLIALGFYKSKMLSAILLFISLGMHHSMMLPIGAFILCYFVKDPKTWLKVWIICLLLSALHITQIMEFIGRMIEDADDHGAGYLLGEQTNLKKGFRPDFILYSAVPVVLGYWVMIKKGFKSTQYTFIWNAYVACNSLWLLCMYASFTNRIAYLSWMMYPIVLIYPFLVKTFMDNQVKFTKGVILYHLLFTLFMKTIYYS